MCSVVLALYLVELQRYGAAATGVLLALGMAGGLLAMLLVSVHADRIGRRQFMCLLGLLSAAGATVLALAQSAPVLAAACFFGMVNGMGRERGASTIFDQAILPQTTDDLGRTRALAWYNVWLDAGHALGALLGVLPKALQALFGLDTLASYRGSLLVLAGLLLAAALIPLLFSSQVEVKTSLVYWKLSRQSQRRVVGFSALSALDSLGGGFFAGAILAYWFYKRFNVDEAWIGPLFCAARVLNGFSHLAAARLASRLGLLRTMVFTHIPSSLLLMATTFAPTFPIAVIIYLLREGLSEMDLPTRQSYLIALVRPEERTSAIAVTTLIRNAAWAVAPAFAGPLMQGVALWVPLCTGAGLKIVYDVLLYGTFRRIKPPEEAAESAGAA